MSDLLYVIMNEVHPGNRTRCDTSCTSRHAHRVVWCGASIESGSTKGYRTCTSVCAELDGCALSSTAVCWSIFYKVPLFAPVHSYIMCRMYINFVIMQWIYHAGLAIWPFAVMNLTLNRTGSLCLCFCVIVSIYAYSYTHAYTCTCTCVVRFIHVIRLPCLCLYRHSFSLAYKYWWCTDSWLANYGFCVFFGLLFA